MKKGLLVFSFLLCLSLTTKAQIFFETDFSSAEVWDQFTTYDLDGLKPYYSDWGTAPPYNAWIRDSYSSSQKIAISTSWYNPPGASNDWLVSPAITIPANVTDAVLTWEGVAFDPSYRDGYKVYISTNGKEVANFTQLPVFSIAEEESYLKGRSISLSEYAGKTIHIAWVNDSKDMYILGITNIAVYSNAIDFKFDTEHPSYLPLNQSDYTVKGTIKNRFSPITSFTAYYSAKGQTYSQTFENLNIASGATYDFSFNEKISVAAGEAVPYQVWVVVDTKETDKQSRTVARVAETYTRKVVGEEGTGTWCGWCPRGAVYMAEARKKYPETFIGIAAHNGDPMVVAEYNAALNFSGYPGLKVNRTVSTDPAYYESAYNQFINQGTPAKIALSAQYTNASKQRIAAKIRTDFAVNYTNTANFKLSFIVTENEVKGSENGYAQVNNYAGGAYGPMGGYENLPATVPAAQMVYQEVARALVGPFSGLEESIPTTLSVGTPVEFTYTFDLPANILNKDNIEVVALLIDNNTGEIVNADRVPASEISMTSIKEIQLTGLTVNAYKNSPKTVAIQVETENAKQVSIEIYGLDAKLVKTIAPETVSGSRQFIVPSEDLKGIYLVKVRAGQQIVTTKVIF